ncbi:hypothetical protein LZ495_43510 [Yinghuangia sp. KLBMP8922]|uniref:Uncharacterized protein n=1 Tax=Yinghuangia soli TaxID=2908204 RepID=A0AA41QA63_9ACTN|nr:hypothetical protein [Yinghuangia soli]
MAARMGHDSGHHGLTQRYFVQALRLAQTAEDRRLAGSILSAMNLQATFLGRFTEAANLARAALLGTERHRTATMTAQSRAMEARALARLGEEASCSAALSKATSILDRQNTSEDPESINYFDNAELSAEFGHCFRDLKQPGQATAYAELCLGGTDGSYIRSDFFATMVLADSLLDRGTGLPRRLGRTRPQTPTRVRPMRRVPHRVPGPSRSLLRNHHRGRLPGAGDQPPSLAAQRLTASLLYA